jgi:hypothetical protein
MDVHNYAFIARKAFHGFIHRLAPVVFENAFVVQGEAGGRGAGVRWQSVCVCRGKRGTRQARAALQRAAGPFCWLVTPPSQLWQQGCAPLTPSTTLQATDQRSCRSR